MHGRLIVRIVVHALDNVDLAGYGPFCAVRPESGPCTTTRRHVDTVHNKEPAREAVLCLNADGVAVARHLGRIVDPHDSVSGTID